MQLEFSMNTPPFPFLGTPGSFQRKVIHDFTCSIVVVHSLCLHSCIICVLAFIDHRMFPAALCMELFLQFLFPSWTSVRSSWLPDQILSSEWHPSPLLDPPCSLGWPVLHSPSFDGYSSQDVPPRNITDNFISHTTTWVRWDLERLGPRCPQSPC